MLLFLTEGLPPTLHTTACRDFLAPSNQYFLCK